MQFSDGIAAVIELFVSASRYSNLTTISMRARTGHCKALNCPHSLSPFLPAAAFIRINFNCSCNSVELLLPRRQLWFKCVSCYFENSVTTRAGAFKFGISISKNVHRTKVNLSCRRHHISVLITP